MINNIYKNLYDTNNLKEHFESIADYIQRLCLIIKLYTNDGKKEYKESIISILTNKSDCIIRDKEDYEFVYSPMLEGKRLVNIESPFMREVICG